MGISCCVYCLLLICPFLHRIKYRRCETICSQRLHPKVSDPPTNPMVASGERRYRHSIPSRHTSAAPWDGQSWIHLGEFQSNRGWVLGIIGIHWQCFWWSVVIGPLMKQNWNRISLKTCLITKMTSATRTTTPPPTTQKTSPSKNKFESSDANECMNAWMHEWINEWMNEWMNEWIELRGLNWMKIHNITNQLRSCFCLFCIAKNDGLN